jgi:hypothetical protein
MKPGKKIIRSKRRSLPAKTNLISSKTSKPSKAMNAMSSFFRLAMRYDEEGHFYQRFGPLNVLGGERRLNVAITRAKYALELVSSIQG